jgi:hypothetical protein
MSTAATDHSPCRIRCSPPRLTPSGIRYGPLVANTTSRKGSAVPEDTFGHPEAFLDLPQLVKAQLAASRPPTFKPPLVLGVLFTRAA